MAVAEEFDCQRCGACCKNPSENVAEGVTAYVEVASTDAILSKKDLVRKLVVLTDEGTPVLRLDAEGRCLALRGRLGSKVSCAIYAHRPSPCRRVERGSKLCLRYRADHLVPSTS